MCAALTVRKLAEQKWPMPGLAQQSDIFSIRKTISPESLRRAMPRQ
jgi:hypothetical protein